MGLLIGTGSSSAHALLDLLSIRVGGQSCHVLPDGCDVERSGDPEGPRERSSTLSQVDARQVGVHAGPSTGQASGGVDGEDTVGHDDAQQGGLELTHPASHTGADRAPETSRL